MADLRFDLTYFANGRRIVRTTRIGIPVSEGTPILDRIELRVDGSLLLSIPMTLDSQYDDDDEGEQEPSNKDFASIYKALTGYDPEE